MKQKLVAISIVGMGYVGLCTAATFASHGIRTRDYWLWIAVTYVSAATILTGLFVMREQRKSKIAQQKPAIGLTSV